MPLAWKTVPTGPRALSPLQSPSMGLYVVGATVEAADTMLYPRHEASVFACRTLDEAMERARKLYGLRGGEPQHVQIFEVSYEENDFQGLHMCGAASWTLRLARVRVERMVAEYP